MPSTPPVKSLRFSATAVEVAAPANALALPRGLAATTRDGASAHDPLLAGYTVERRYQLAGVRRGEAAQAETLDSAAPQLLALETEDGETLFIRSDALAESVARLQPDAIVDGAVELERFHVPNAATRGGGEVLWKAVSVLASPADAILDEAREQLGKWLRDQLVDAAEGAAYDAGSFLGVKALMWAIESRLAGNSGLYRWDKPELAPTDLCSGATDPRLAAAGRGEPMLLLIHGTASHTQASFAELRRDTQTWATLEARYPGGIFGYEHRSFSQSPSENALEILAALPAGARVSLLTHSRGGLVGDLLCLEDVGETLLAAYRIDDHDAADRDGLAHETKDERQRLRDLFAARGRKRVVFERYVRVACPARGTRLLSENLDAALSDFLGVASRALGALGGLAAGAVGGPVAGQAVGQGVSSALGVVKRLILEIAERRIDARLVPGIAAMRTDSPLVALLGHPGAARSAGVSLAVIAGDTEFDGFGFSSLRRRVANLFADWKLFDRNDNDLVVDTDSMFAGLAFRPGAHYFYQQDETVTHFRYFGNRLTRDALRDWLSDDAVAAGKVFLPLDDAPRVAQKAVARGGDAAARPVAIVLPGIMGSHIEVYDGKPGKTQDRDRIWFHPLRLAAGGLDQIADVEANNFAGVALFERFYGDFEAHLAATHSVYRCPYDWRHTPERAADDLKALIDQAAQEHPGQPIRLLAHSMGGLVARAMIAKHPDAWKTVRDSGGRLVMLGTPNNGSHQMVHGLLGKSDSLRTLEKLDATHDLREILDIVARFPGALSLLPRPGFTDTGETAADYFAAATWPALGALNTDRWYGDGVVGAPAQAMLDRARQFWDGVLANNEIAHPEAVVYVFGQGEKTPCGLARQGNRLQLQFTAQGDGTVSWASGRLANLPEAQCWYMPVEHGDLANDEAYFPAIVDLLQRGTTERLERLPRTRGAAAQPFVLEAGPPVVASEDELARAFVGAGPRRRRRKPQRVLKIAVRGGDLRFCTDRPMLCGHYLGDPISGAEAQLDDLLGGQLSLRERMGQYAAERGTSAIVLHPQSVEERARGTQRGALIVGMGDFNGQLGARQLADSVRLAVERYLLVAKERGEEGVVRPLALNSLLLGFSSSTAIDVAASVAAVVRGVLLANREFARAEGENAKLIEALTFVELYRDAAISAARAVRDLPATLADEFTELGGRVAPAFELEIRQGVCERLQAGAHTGHWARLVVTDADAPDVACPAECYETTTRSPIPSQFLKSLCPPAAVADTPNPALPATGVAAAVPVDAPSADARVYPERLKYLFLSRSARAESIVHRRQPGLVEMLVRAQRANPAYDAELGRTLFQLMVPLDYKAAARDQERLILVLDDATANLPWELMSADGGPMAIRTCLVRQLAATRCRRDVRYAGRNLACVIVSPDTGGYRKRFGGKHERLPELAGAVREGAAIDETLKSWGAVEFCPEGRAAADVIGALYRHPYRVLAIAAHGVFEARGLDGRSYTGVVLSDGMTLGALEVAQMETVPELVFLNCCHLGGVNLPGAGDLAASLARELIGMGVRCLLVAGWAVDDGAAETFSRNFFRRMAAGERFGDAVHAARTETWCRHPGSNTWGAYQAYGDPAYRLHIVDDGGRDDETVGFVAVEEWLAELRERALDTTCGTGAPAATFDETVAWVERGTRRCPPGWNRRADVQAALGELYASWGDAGYARARDAYLAALCAPDGTGERALHVVERLADLERREGERMADGEPPDPEAGLKLIDAAITRLLALGEASAHDEGGARDPVCERDAERGAILGSAYKHRAAVLARRSAVRARNGTAWDAVADDLGHAAEAYRSGLPDDPAERPDSALNAAQLDWLVNGKAPDPMLTQRCGASARARFARSFDFRDAVNDAHAKLAAWLFGEQHDDPVETLHAAYVAAVKPLPESMRQWDAVVSHWRLLADLLECRGKDGDKRRVEVLRALANRPAGDAPEAPVAAAPGADQAKAPAAKPATTGKGKARTATATTTAATTTAATTPGKRKTPVATPLASGKRKAATAKPRKPRKPA